MYVEERQRHCQRHVCRGKTETLSTACIEERQRHCQRHVCRGKTETLSTACMSRKDRDIVNSMYVEERLRHCGMYVQERVTHKIHVRVFYACFKFEYFQ